MCCDHLESLPVLLGDDNHLFGVQTLPATSKSRFGVIILNAGLLHHVGPFRLHVDISNQLGKVGFPTIRLDQSGKGESPQRPGRSRYESMLLDYDDVFSSLRSLDVSGTIIVGLCSGADDALYVASQRDSIVGLILLDGYACKNMKFRVRHYANRIFEVGPWLRAIRRLTGARDFVPEIDIRDWANDDEMIRRYGKILDKDTRVLSVFTAGQNYYNHLGQLAAGMPDGCKLHNLQELYFDQVDHTYNVTYHRIRLLGKIVRWMTDNFSST